MAPLPDAQFRTFSVSADSDGKSKLELLNAAFKQLPKPDTEPYNMIDSHCRALGLSGTSYTVVHDMLEQVTKAGTNKVTGPDRILVFDALAEIQAVIQARSLDIERSSADEFRRNNIHRTIGKLQVAEDALKVCASNLAYAVPQRARGQEQGS
jgi:hypothetical protein